MTGAEIRVVCIGIFFLGVYTLLLKQDLKRNLTVFALAFLFGIPVQASLGPRLNLYTPSFQLYIGYVNVATLVIWGIALTSIYAVHLLAARLFRVRPGALLFLLTAVPVIVLVEVIGTHIVQAKLTNYAEYSPLLPMFNSMHAPLWLYGYYGVIQFLFYRLLKRLGIAGEPVRRHALVKAPADRPSRTIPECK